MRSGMRRFAKGRGVNGFLFSTAVRGRFPPQAVLGPAFTPGSAKRRDRLAGALNTCPFTGILAGVGFSRWGKALGRRIGVCARIGRLKPLNARRAVNGPRRQNSKYLLPPNPA